MAHSMAYKGQAFKAGTPPRIARRAARAPVAVHATKQEASVLERLAPALLAGIVAFTGVNATYAPFARADDEEFMSPYQKRQAEMERRRELLREARERAAARASGVEVDEAAAPEATPQPEPAKPSTDFSAQAARLKKESLKAYEDAAKNRPAPPVTAEPEEAPAPAAPKFGGFRFGKPAEPSPAPAAPTPAPATPAPRPVVPVPMPVPVPAPAPVQKVQEQKPEPKKAEAPKNQAVSKKRRGPLPLWFAEILVLGAYVALGLAVTKYSEQSGKVLGAVWSKIVELYTAAEKFIASRTQPST